MKIKPYSIQLLLFVIPFLLFSSLLCAEDLVINVQDFGAIGDGKTINTNYIQAAIDSAYKEGGGRIYFPSGQWMTGKIFLKSNIIYKNRCKYNARICIN